MHLVQSVLTTLASATAIVSLTGCLAGPGFLKQQGNASLVSDSSKVDATIISSQDGAITGAITGNSGDTQVLSAADGSGIEGASVLFPPGSLGVDANITVEAGASLASDATAAELGLDNDFTAASDAVVVSADTDLEAINPFTIAISMSGSGLVEIDRARVVIVFKAKKADGTFVTGVIPNSQLTFDGDKVQFETTKFGSFQAVTTAAVITEKKEVATVAPIVTKREEVVLPEPKDFRVVTVEPKAIKFAWASGGGTTAGFAMVFGNDTPPPSCLGAKFIGDLNKVEGRIDTLVANKTYGFRLCSVGKDGKQSAGVVVTQKTAAISDTLGSFGVNPTTPHRFPSGSTIPFLPSDGATSYEVRVGFNSNCSGTTPIPMLVVQATEPLVAGIDKLGDGGYFLCLTAKKSGLADLKAPPFEFEIESSEVQLTFTTSVGINSTLKHFYYDWNTEQRTDLQTGSTAGDKISAASSLALKSDGTALVVYSRRDGLSERLWAGDPMATTFTSTELSGGFISPTGGDYIRYGKTISGPVDRSNAAAVLFYKDAMTSGGSVFFKAILDKRDDIPPLASSTSASAPIWGDVDGAFQRLESEDRLHAVFSEETGFATGAFRWYWQRQTNPVDWSSATVMASSSMRGTSGCSSTFAPSIAVRGNKPEVAYICKQISPPYDCVLRLARGKPVDASPDPAYSFTQFDIDVIATDANSCGDAANHTRLRPDIAIDSAGRTHISYANNIQLKIRRAIVPPTAIDNTTPDTIIHEVQPTDSNAGFTRLALDKFNKEYIFYVDGSRNGMLVSENRRPFGNTNPYNNATMVFDSTNVSSQNIDGVGNLVITGRPGRSAWVPTP